MSEWLICIYIVAAFLTVAACTGVAFWLVRIERTKAIITYIKDNIKYDDQGKTAFLMDPELITTQMISLSKIMAISLCILAAIIIICITSIIKPNKPATKTETNKCLFNPNSLVEVNIACHSCKVNATPLQITESTKPKAPDTSKDTVPQPSLSDSNACAVPSKTPAPDTMKKEIEMDNNSKQATQNKSSN